MKNSVLLFGLILVSISCKNTATSEHDSTKKVSSQNVKTKGLNETKEAYFGDLHVHTSWSFDAFIYNVRTSPGDAYRFGKGEAISHVSGKEVQLTRALDFMAVSDHSEYMGVMMQMKEKNNPLSKLNIAKRINSDDPKVSRRAFGEIGMGIASNDPNKKLLKKEGLMTTWERIVEAAERHNDPGVFTTFPAYEWTSSLGIADSNPQYAKNMHRNVIYKGGEVSEVPFSSFHSQNPEDLWAWMELQRSKGIELLAIPHNANISDGKMYALNTFEGKEMNDEYVAARMKNEPVSEVIQIKGQSMVHPALSPNDEFANFEIYQHTLGRSEPRYQSRPEGSFVRDAFKNGLAIENKLGSNPFQFGVIGSSDGHNGASNQEEFNNVGKSGFQDATPEIRLADTPDVQRHRQTSVGGLAGVWAAENTRESIFGALENKEVFATSGTRIKVRFFAGWKYGDIDLDSDEWLKQAYANGVAMGGELNRNAEDNNSPNFLIWALKDSDSGNLDRVQVIKGWVDENGHTQEKIFDVAWSDDREKDASGNLPAVANTVNTTTATYTNDVGAVSLKAIWKDPEYSSAHNAFYYLRVLEIPTPRWTTYDAVLLDKPLPDGVPPTIQERAWSSPIWVKP